MSNARHETIADIVADIRAQNIGLPEDSYALSPLVGDLLSLARRIEVANARERGVAYNYAQICGEIGEMIGREATSEKYSQVGNAAKMREALVRAQRVLHCAIVAEILKGDDAQEALNVVTAALSTPPRNCDVLSKDEALKVLDDRSFSKEDTIEWLYDKAEGGTDGSK